jgi:hypothetical protein
MTQVNVARTLAADPDWIATVQCQERHDGPIIIKTLSVIGQHPVDLMCELLESGELYACKLLFAMPITADQASRLRRLPK